MYRFKQLATVVLLGLVLAKAQAAQLNVAVAANFKTTLEALLPAFEAQSGHQTRVSSASTGVLYAQILRGAPYDLFLAADAERPRLLEAAGHTLPGTRTTYALGRLALWIPASQAAVNPDSLSGIPRLAVANPKTAPYGRAAVEVIEALAPQPAPTLIRGNNIAQAFQFVESGNVVAGFVALSLLRQSGQPEARYWQVPQTLHAPIEQQLVGLKRTEHADAVQALIDFLSRPEMRLRIAEAGYGTEASR